MFGGTFQREPFGKDAVIGFETTATSFYQVAFIILQFRHGWIIFGFPWGKDGHAFLRA